MLFAIAMDVLMVAALVMLYRAATRPNHLHKRLFVAAFLALLALCGFAFLAAIVPGPIDRMNWSPVAFGAFGLLASMLFLVIAGSIARELRRGTIAGISFRLGGCVLCLMAGLYVVFACLDHYWFFRGDRAGVANVAGMGIPDVFCNDELLVRVEEEGADFRCPRSFVFGRDTRAPFAPDYISGRSIELARRIVELQTASDDAAGH
jgi:hypothetical protein